jgi:hypothetical protein
MLGRINGLFDRAELAESNRVDEGHGNDSDTEDTLRKELTREPFLAGAGVH